MRGGSEGGGGSHASFTTFPFGQQQIDDENDGEILANYVYEGIRPTISQESLGAPRSPLSAAYGGGGGGGGRVGPVMEAEEQRRLHHKLMSEAHKAGKLNSLLNSKL